MNQPTYHSVAKDPDAAAERTAERPSAEVFSDATGGVMPAHPFEPEIPVPADPTVEIPPGPEPENPKKTGVGKPKTE